MLKFKKGEILNETMEKTPSVVAAKDVCGNMLAAQDLVICSLDEANTMAKTMRLQRNLEFLKDGSCSLNPEDLVGRSVLFLDMDGVMNRAFMSKQYINPECYEHLKYIIEHTDAKVVLSTSWREFPDWNVFLHDFFALVGIDIIGSTPVLNEVPNGVVDVRPEEIRMWMIKYGFRARSFCVVDDNDYRPNFGSHAVCTCAENRVGLDEKWAYDIVCALNKKEMAYDANLGDEFDGKHHSL